MSVIKARLFPRAEAAVRAGHPWVFAESVKSLSRQGEPGEMVAVYDRRDRMMALGFHDPASPIRIRILHVGDAVRIDREWWFERAVSAMEMRRALISADTDGVRCIHGENDGFPGLVADQYADTLVVKLYSAVWLPRWEEIEQVLREVMRPRHLVLRLSRNLREPAAEFRLTEGFHGNAGQPVVVFREHGLRFEADVLHGQKTGFFLDQRENRVRVAAMSAGKEVLNLFSYTGGFSVHAAGGGARRVVDVDISNHALESARRNFALNPALDGCSHLGIRADVFEWLRNDGGSFDLVISDPPSLAKRERERAGAIKAYRALNAAAINRVGQGGFLLAASCSAHVSEQEFFSSVRSAAVASGRSFHTCWTSGHAADHPATFAEARYLKAMCLSFDSRRAGCPDPGGILSG